MNKPLHFPSTGSASNAAGRSGSRVLVMAGHPTPQSIGFEIAVILVVTLAIACAVSLALRAYGFE